MESCSRSNLADARPSMNPALAFHLRIRGHVQGVGYRQALRSRALEAGVSGWVRNRRDGTVEACVEGPPAAVQALIDWARIGPPAARVTAVEVEAALADRLAQAGFEARPTA